ncbi:MAG: hypothetical protein PVH29_14885 [Candidatus Zixiibacteriota bacterium]|jgi:hypothetical protein
MRTPNLKHIVVTTALLTALSSAGNAAELAWSGYFRNDVTVTERRFGLVTGTRLGNYLRLRLDLDASLNDHVSAMVTPEFVYLSGDKARDPYLGAPLDRDYDVGLNRAQVDFFWDRLQLTLGKQRLDLSTAYFYSPLDVFNPVDFTEPTTERDGVTGGRATVYFSGFAGGRLIMVPEDRWDESPKAARAFATVGDFDFGATYLEPGYDYVHTVGLDFSGSVGDLGIYGEAAADVHGTAGEAGARGTLGLNYGWRKGPNVSLEYYRDQRGAADTAAYDLKDYFLGRRLTLGRDVAGAVITYYPHPLWLAGAAAAVNVHDGSYYVNPSLTWSAFEDVDLKLESDYFGGEPQSEFYYQHPIYRFQVMAYF